MGLDISYYGKARFVREHDDSGDYDWPREFGVTINSDFPAQADDLKEGVYSADITGAFRAGSYGGYNRWRNQLAQIAGYGSADAAWKLEEGGKTDGPFWQLINFSDCEGVIGPVTAAKLARDFAEYQHVADSHPDDHFRERYNLWQQAFETASDSGVVVFH